MIIVLKNANFSENNVGKIELPVAWQSEMDDILRKQTRYSKEDSQAIALNKFIFKLKDSGIFSKLICFVPTFMANSLQECAYDVISNTYLQWGGSGTPTYNQSDETVTNTRPYGAYATLNNIPFGNSFILNSFEGAYHRVWNDENFSHWNDYNTKKTVVEKGVSNPGGTNFYRADNGKSMGLSITNIVTGNNIDEDGSSIYKNVKFWKSGTPAVTDFSNESFSRLLIGSPSQNIAVSVKKEFHIFGNTSLSDTELDALYNAAQELRDTLSGE